MPSLTCLIEAAKTQLDLAESSDRASLDALAAGLLASFERGSTEPTRAALGAGAPLELRIAAKLAESRRYLWTVTKPVKLGVVFAMWGEHHRLRPRSPDNPNGEDALRVKLQQLAWATADTPVDWTAYAVDDGDPHHSGRLAAEIAATEPSGEKMRVLWLADALPAATGPLAGLESADHSRKGGAVIHGCARACRRRGSGSAG